MFIQKYFRRQVLGRSTESVRQFVRAQIRFGKTEVTQRDVTCGIEQDVLWFQVTARTFSERAE